MRMGLATDAACDLSPAFLKQHNVTVMPIAVRVDDETFLDDRQPAELQRFIDRRLGSRSHSAETEPCSVDQVQALFLDRLVLEQDYVFCVTITATRSPINEHVNRASFGVLKGYREVRERAGVAGPFMMRVVDTRNIFAGAAPAIHEAARMIAAGETPAAIRERLLHVAHHSYGYMLPRDLYYLRARAKKKNDHSVSLISAMLGSALDIKPLLRCHRGETGPVGKVRGFEHGAEALFGYAARRGACGPAGADDLRELRRRSGRAAQPARLSGVARDLHGMRRGADGSAHEHHRHGQCRRGRGDAGAGGGRSRS